ncbi:MAG: hypothetical protein PVSMB10_02710 [Pseudarthrobacter sp.]
MQPGHPAQLGLDEAQGVDLTVLVAQVGFGAAFQLRHQLWSEPVLQLLDGTLVDLRQASACGVVQRR